MTEQELKQLLLDGKRLALLISEEHHNKEVELLPIIIEKLDHWIQEVSRLEYEDVE